MRIGSYFYVEILRKIGLGVHLGGHLGGHFCKTWVDNLTKKPTPPKMEIHAIIFVFAIKGIVKNIENYIFILGAEKVLKRLSSVQ